MTMRLYLDADAMRQALVDSLRERGADVETALEAKLKDASDEEQLAYAAAQGRVLYSFNIGDFMALHTLYIIEGKDHAGIILAPQQRYSIGEQMRRLLRIVQMKSAVQMRNTIEFLGTWR